MEENELRSAITQTLPLGMCIRRELSFEWSHSLTQSNYSLLSLEVSHEIWRETRSYSYSTRLQQTYKIIATVIGYPGIGYLG